jgi:hypothetical protein
VIVKGEVRRILLPRTRVNRARDLASLTPTHIDYGPTEHGREPFALQLHLKDPESSLS